MPLQRPVTFLIGEFLVGLRRAMRCAAFALVAATAAVAPATHADVLYVDDSATGANSGANWDDAFTDLQDALAIAQAGDEIRIGQGVYKPAPPNGSREATFNLVDAVTVRGGFAGTGAADPDAHDPETFVTRLSGDLNGDDLEPPNYANHVDTRFTSFRRTQSWPVLKR